MQEDTQTDYGRLFEMLADLTDEDGTLAELQDSEKFAKWMLGDPEADPGPEPDFEPPTTGEYLLDEKARINNYHLPGAAFLWLTNDVDR